MKLNNGELKRAFVGTAILGRSKDGLPNAFGAVFFRPSITGYVSAADQLSDARKVHRSRSESVLDAVGIAKALDLPIDDDTRAAFPSAYKKMKEDEKLLAFRALERAQEKADIADANVATADKDASDILKAVKPFTK